ncbi:MAG: ABC transporter permease, partial [Clostridia bacterium]|nr:ABC transporter permease [Clostridia bacterium]
MKAFLKDFFRELSRNKGRFISVFFIVLLGAAFFSGIRASKSDMHISAGEYYKVTNFMDLQVLGTLDVTEDDIKDIKDISGVKVVEGEYNMEAICNKDVHSEVIKLVGITKETNKYVVLEGRAPKNDTECMVDEKFLNNTGYKIGDTISLETGTEDKI